MVLRLDALSVVLDVEGEAPRPIVEELSLRVRSGETTALLGESGCGKTLTALACLGLLPPGLRRSAGRIELEGRELRGEDDFRAIRGRRVGMVFQEPRAAMSPAFGVGAQLVDVLRAHRTLGRRAARRVVESWLERVGIPSPERRFGDPPHRFSGGQLQRIMIAAALLNEPALLIADEPTSSLDVTVQGRILGLLRRLQRELGLAILLITHDLRVVGAMAHETCAMRARGSAR